MDAHGARAAGDLLELAGLLGFADELPVELGIGSLKRSGRVGSSSERAVELCEGMLVRMLGARPVAAVAIQAYFDQLSTAEMQAMVSTTEAELAKATAALAKKKSAPAPAAPAAPSTPAAPSAPKAPSAPAADGAVGATNADEDVDEELGEWRKALTEAGKVYWWNVRTRESRWDDPMAAAFR